MTKPVSTIKKIRRQHTPEFRHEALKLAERIGCPLPPSNLPCMNHSSITGAVNSKISSLLLSANKRGLQRSPV